ncbi:Uncharacterized conserved protein, DUF305 family [Streptomyces sp. 2231.1]|uniref:DUF305 domain-containing protein n=1 Tax=Streptomyces sp. 2231.1 TaxID=1855347 RepID=UPI000898C0A2|nr:DUF305 domain-containing protein [Streptomyces sp. 2231.1]SEE37432.1 Uncharacterized conserved protein, DUF305 family [Streptomyces sp. 2231.1]
MAFRRSLIRRTAVPAAAAVAAVILAACGSSESSSSKHAGHGMGARSSARASATAPAAQGSHNGQDVSFVLGMIPHHRQAVAMADLAPSRAKSQRVKDLAAKIKQAQDPEINTMSGWLKAWGEKVPHAGTSGMDHSSMPGMDHSSTPGMMSGDDMGKLKDLSGDSFDEAFVQMMVSHHRGAIEMAKTEQAKGAYGPATTMAKSIVTSQSAEIAEMNKILGKQ